MEPLWSGTLDGRWKVSVVQDKDNDYRGTLTITDQGLTIYSTSVGIAYGAIFGADSSDIAYWKSLAMEFIDSRP